MARATTGAGGTDRWTTAVWVVLGVALLLAAALAATRIWPSNPATGDMGASGRVAGDMATGLATAGVLECPTRLAGEMQTGVAGEISTPLLTAGVMEFPLAGVMDTGVAGPQPGASLAGDIHTGATLASTYAVAY